MDNRYTISFTYVSHAMKRTDETVKHNSPSLIVDIVTRKSHIKLSFYCSLLALLRWTNVTLTFVWLFMLSACIYIFRLWQHFVVTYYFFHSSSLRSFFDISPPFIQLPILAIIFRQLVHGRRLDHFKIQKWNDDYQIIDLFDGLCSVIFSNNKRTNGSKGYRRVRRRAHAEWTKQTYITFIAIAAVAVYLLFFSVEFWSLYSLRFSSLLFFCKHHSIEYGRAHSLNSFVIRSLVCHSFAYPQITRTHARTHTFLLVCCWCNSPSSVFMMRKTAQNEKRF